MLKIIWLNTRLKQFIFSEQQSGDTLFWDVVVLTAADESQKTAYETQLQIKLDDHLLPLNTNYIVVADPPNYKIGMRLLL